MFTLFPTILESGHFHSPTTWRKSFSWTLTLRHTVAGERESEYYEVLSEG